MENITNYIPQELLQALRQFTPYSKIVVLAFSDDYYDEIFHSWQENRGHNPNWTLQAIDETTAERFGISIRTVKRVRYKMAKVAQQKIDKQKKIS